MSWKKIVDKGIWEAAGHYFIKTIILYLIEYLLKLQCGEKYKFEL